MADRYTQRLEQVTDRYLQSSFGLWSALLTVNGILLAAFSTIKASENAISNYIVVATTILCVISLVLVVYNFVATKQTYYRIGEVMADERAELTDEQKEKDINKAVSRRAIMIFNEKACLFLLLLEAAMILFLVVYSVNTKMPLNNCLKPTAYVAGAPPASV